MGLEPTLELFTTYQTSSTEIGKMEADLAHLQALAKSLEGKVVALMKFIEFYEATYPEYLNILPGNDFDSLKKLDRNSIISSSWGERIKMILKASSKPMYVGDIMNFIRENKWHKDDEKTPDIRRRVHSQLHYMANNHHVLKVEDGNGYQYSIPESL